MSDEPRLATVKLTEAVAPMGSRMVAVTVQAASVVLGAVKVTAEVEAVSDRPLSTPALADHWKVSAPPSGSEAWT